MLRNYPVQATLLNGAAVTLRPMTREDGPGLLRFFRGLPPEDRLWLRDDVTDESIIERWTRHLDYGRIIPILGELEGEIVGDATLHRSEHNWMRHVGEIRVVTSPRVRRQGLGTLLAREVFNVALILKLEKIIARMSEDQTGVRRVFEGLGFHEEALLKGYVMDPRGQTRDMVILAQDVSHFWSKIEDQIEDSLGDRSGGY